MFNFSEMAKNMSIAQRLLYNLDNGMDEREFNTPKPPPNWPQRGKIVVKNIEARYRRMFPLVIKNVSF